jgi:hypothetical protein
MNLNEIETLLNDFHTFTNEKWEYKFIKKIYGQKFGLFDRNNFVVKINNVNIRLNKTSQNKSASNTTTDISTYFNNTGLLEISDYAMQKYNQVPNDSSLTRFYNLTLDRNYNVKPVLE